MRLITAYCSLLILWLALLSPSLAQPWVQEPNAATPLVTIKSEDQLQARREALDEEAAALDRLRLELRQKAENLPGLLEQLTAETVTEAQVEQARVDVQADRLRLENQQIELASTERRIQELEQTIQSLEAREQLLRNPATGDAAGAERAQELTRTTQAIARLRQELELERRHREQVVARNELARQRLALNSQWFNRLDELWRSQQERSRQVAQQDLEQQLLQQQAALRAEAAQAAQQLQEDGLSAAERRVLESRLEVLEARAKLVDQQMRLARIGNDLARLEGLAAAGEVPVRELAGGLEQLRNLTIDLSASRDLLRRGLELGRQQVEALDPADLSGAEARTARQRRELVQQLVGEMEERLDQVQGQLDRANFLNQRLDALYQERLSENLFQRRELPDSMAAWQQLLQGILAAPRTLLIQVQVSVQAALETMAAAGPSRWAGLVLLELLLLGLVLWVSRTLDVTIQRVSQRTASFLGSLSLVLLRVARRNLWGLGIALGLIAALWVARVPQPGLGIILTLVLLYVGIKVPITLARLVLVSSRIPEAERRPQLFRQLALVLICGGLLAAVTILAHLSSLPLPVLDVFDRLFMLYLLLITPPVLRLRAFLHDKLAGRYGERAWFIVLRLVLLVLPLSLTAAALLGVVGYVELAWTVAWHLVAIILISVGWLVVRGLVSDLVVWLKNYAVTHSGYGLLWTQEIINPVHRIVELFLFLGAWVVLLQVYGWDGESAFVVKLWAVLDDPLFTFGGADISLWRILVTLISVLVVVWFGQWTRAVTYRWIFSRITDLGVRHSLSVFLQYAIVLIGFLVILRSIGLDLTALTVFAGAVGVGIGFGMQAIANNFVSGLLLLIERPLRSGDIVRIGSNEGTITRIGIRSLTMETFDKLEVIIPNSDVITSAFTNWTHSDNTIRTVILLRVSYDAEPAKIQTLLERVVFTHPAVLGDPEPLVVLWEFTDSAIIFRIQYYMDIIKYHIFKVRNEILLGVWDTLKKAGVRMPHAQQDLYIKEWPEHRLPPGQGGQQSRGGQRPEVLPDGAPDTTRPLIGI